MEVTCYCDTVVDIDIPEKVDLAADAAAETSIMSGEFLQVSCPTCGRVIKPEAEITITHSKEGWSVTLVPEIDRHGVLSGHREVKADRIVIGYTELVEYLSIRSLGLSQDAVEILKAILLQKAPDDTDPYILFDHVEGEKIVFHIHGVRENEVGVAQVSMDNYRQISAKLPEYRKTGPFTGILKGPYVSANKPAEDNE